MLLIFSMPVLIRHLGQLKTVVLWHWCLIHAVLLAITIRLGLKRLKVTYTPGAYVIKLFCP